MRQIVLIAHNLRSTHNIGSLLRTADGLGLSAVYLTGYSPYPQINDDPRMPHLAHKLTNQIAKTALGAEQTVKVQHADDVYDVIKKLKQAGFMICALEQTNKAKALNDFTPPDKVALIVGREVEGLEMEVIKAADQVLQIPMFGQKESFNVSVAAAMALYKLRFD